MFQSAYRQITASERVFVDRLVKSLHTAAKRQGDPVRGCLDKPLPAALMQLDTRGYLQRPLVCAAINEQIIECALADEISPTTTAREIHRIAHASVNEFYYRDEYGDLVVDEKAFLDPEKAAAIKSIEYERGDSLTRNTRVRVKITMHDKIAALKMELALMGMDDGDSPYRKTDRAANSRNLPVGATAQQAGDVYASMIGDD